MFYFYMKYYIVLLIQLTSFFLNCKIDKLLRTIYVPIARGGVAQLVRARDS